VLIKQPKINVPMTAQNQFLIQNNMSHLHQTAYVEMRSTDQAENAIKNLNGTTPFGGSQRISVQFYVSKNSLPASASHGLFLKGFNKALSEDDLRTILTNPKHGVPEFKSLQLKNFVNANGEEVRSGRATLYFATSDRMNEAVKKLYMIAELGNHVQVDLYQSKDSRMLQREMTDTNQ